MTIKIGNFSRRISPLSLLSLCADKAPFRHNPLSPSLLHSVSPSYSAPGTGIAKACHVMKPTLALLLTGLLLSSVSLPANAGESPRNPNTKHQLARSINAKGGEDLLKLQTRPSADQRLASDTQIPELSPLAAAWAALPKRTFLEHTVHNGVPARLAVHEIGPASGIVYVCIHGIFGQADNWKYLAGAIKGEHELWLVDLPGSGQSDCPDPKRSGPRAYGPKALAERVLQALEARLAVRSDVSRVIVVAHSFGGMITLRMFVDDELRGRYAQVLSRINGLALFAPCDVVARPTDTWKTFLGIDPVKARVGSMLQILQGALVDSLHESFHDPKLASRELATESIQLLQNGQSRRASQQILLDGVVWRVFAKSPDWNVIRRLQTGYKYVNVPCLVVWGECDETLPVDMGYKLKDQLPNARLVLLANTMHLLPLERPALCADLVREFDHQLAAGSLAEVRSFRTLDPDSDSALLAATLRL